MEPRHAMNQDGKWVEAHFAVQMRGSDFDVRSILEFNGKRWRTLRCCDTKEMAEAEIKAYDDGVRQYRIVPIVDGTISCDD